jgi:dipeptide transport system permease protein
VSHLILPAIVLGTVPLAVIARMTRSAMLEVLGEDYIRTARAKGLPNLRVVTVHAFRNALIPIVTVIGFNVGYLLGGSAFVETIFAWPGIGRLLYDSMFTRDYPTIMGIFLVVSVGVIVANLLTDLAYALLDPRVRY